MRERERERDSHSRTQQVVARIPHPFPPAQVAGILDLFCSASSSHDREKSGNGGAATKISLVSLKTVLYNTRYLLTMIPLRDKKGWQ
jgi:hypothetical protein